MGSPQSKISRLPREIRDELNLRILNGEPGSVILPWLNALPEMQEVIAKFFPHDGPVTDNNLSTWRNGQYAKWEERRERLQATKENAKFAADLAGAGKNAASKGAAEILAGSILQLLEATEGKLDPKEFKSLVASVVMLRGAEIEQQRAELEKEKLKRKDAEIQIARQRLRRDDMHRLITWSATPAARAVLGSSATTDEKTEQLGKLIFGEDWE